MPAPGSLGNIKNADEAIVTFGISSRVDLSAFEMAEEAGIKASILLLQIIVLFLKNRKKNHQGKSDLL